MGRVRSKVKKNQDDPTSDEEKIPMQKRRGRPQKTIKDETEEDLVAEKVLEDEDDSEETTNGVSKNKDTKSHSAGKQNGRKRKNNGADVKDEVEYAKDENGSNIVKNKSDEEKKSNGLRQTRHRRKGKPCRAPEAVVECT